MHSGPDGAVGIFGKHHCVIVCRSVGMEKTYHRVKDEPHDEQRYRQTKRLAVDHYASLLSPAWSMASVAELSPQRVRALARQAASRQARPICTFVLTLGEVSASLSRTRS